MRTGKVRDCISRRRMKNYPMHKHLFSLTALSLTIFSGCASKMPPNVDARQVAAARQQSLDRPGYTDTPTLPSGKWHVHDPNRPVPPVVTPGATFSDGAPPPSDAIVLFDGHD